MEPFARGTHNLVQYNQVRVQGHHSWVAVVLLCDSSGAVLPVGGFCRIGRSWHSASHPITPCCARCSSVHKHQHPFPSTPLAHPLTLSCLSLCCGFAQALSALSAGHQAQHQGTAPAARGFPWLHPCSTGYKELGCCRGSFLALLVRVSKTLLQC